MESLAKFIETLAINPREATLTPSKILEKVLELLSFGTKGFTHQTSKKAGKNMPIVARIAPGIPLIKYPINVAVVNTGPGVNCPIATASRSSDFVIS